MNDLTQLLEAGQQMLEDDALLHEKKIAEMNAESETWKSRCLTAVRDALNVDEATWHAFEPTYNSRMRPNVTLHYRGTQICFNVETRGTSQNVFVNSYNSMRPVEYLARKMAEIENQFYRKINQTLADLRLEDGADWQAYEAAQRTLVWNEAVVRSARAAFLVAVYDRKALKTLMEHELWLREVEELRGEPLLTERQDAIEAVERAVRVLRFLDAVNQRRDPQTGEKLGDDDNWDEERGPYSDVVTAEEVAAYTAGAEAAGVMDDARVRQALAERAQQMRDHLLQVEVEEKRAEMERQLFTPFRFYEVRYSLIGERDNGEERFVDWDSFITLHEEPNERGYYWTVGGMVIKPRYIVAVIMRQCDSIEQYRRLAWSRNFKRDTEYGEILVVPAEAEMGEGGRGALLP